MKKRILCIVLSLCLLVGLMPAVVSAADWGDVSGGGIGFHYGSSFLKITKPTTEGYYTYGTASGTSAAQTAANQATLPESGWQWAAQKSGDSIRLILNDFNATYNIRNDGFLLNTNTELELRGTNSYTNTGYCFNALFATNNNDLTITGTGSLTACMTDDSSGYGVYLDNGGTLTIEGGNITLMGGDGGIYGKVVLGAIMKGEASAKADASNPVSFTGGTVDREYEWYKFTMAIEEGNAIALSKNGAYRFPLSKAGGDVAAKLDLTVANLGTLSTGALTLALSGPDADKFTLSQTTIDDIAYLGSTVVTVQPQVGLATGIYKATLTVSGSKVETKTLELEAEFTEFVVLDVGSFSITKEADLQAGVEAGMWTYTKTDNVYTVTLKADLNGQLYINWKNANLIIDANGRTIDGGSGYNEAVTLENTTMTIALIGDGTIKGGQNSTLFVGSGVTLSVYSATIIGRINRYGTIKAVLEEGKSYFTAKKNDKDWKNQYNTEDVTLGDTSRSDTLVVKQMVNNDMNGDTKVDTEDAVYLLLKVLFSEAQYPIHEGHNQDVNKDNAVNTEDAVYLLLHILFGATQYPI